MTLSRVSTESHEKFLDYSHINFLFTALMLHIWTKLLLKHFPLVKIVLFFFRSSAYSSHAHEQRWLKTHVLLMLAAVSRLIGAAFKAGQKSGYLKLTPVIPFDRYTELCKCMKKYCKLRMFSKITNNDYFFISLQNAKWANKRQISFPSVLGVPGVMETRPCSLWNVWLFLPGSVDVVLKAGHTRDFKFFF